MAYLLPAGSVPRTKNKWGLGAIPLANGGGTIVNRPGIIFFRPQTPVGIGPVLPGPMPVLHPQPVLLPSTPTIPATTPSTAGTPVPAGFPVNQFFVAPDGSVWEYSPSSNSWFNTGTPYNTGGSSGGGATSPTPIATNGSGTSAQPVSVTVTTPGAAAESGYQSILDWLTQETLITSVPNWIVAGGVGLLIWKATQSGGKR